MRNLIWHRQSQPVLVLVLTLAGDLMFNQVAFISTVVLNLDVKVRTAEHSDHLSAVVPVQLNLTILELCFDRDGAG